MICAFIIALQASSPDKAQPHPGNNRIPKVGRPLSDDQVTTPRRSTPDTPLAYPGDGLKSKYSKTSLRLMRLQSNLSLKLIRYGV